MITTMRERMDAKCGNSNDNAFRIRKLFLAWDKKSSGLVHYEDLRQVGEGLGPLSKQARRLELSTRACLSGGCNTWRKSTCTRPRD